MDIVPGVHSPRCVSCLLVHFSAVTAPSFWCCASFFPLLSSRFLLCLPFALCFSLWGPACSLLLVAAPAVVTPPSLPLPMHVLGGSLQWPGLALVAWPAVAQLHPVPLPSWPCCLAGGNCLSPLPPFSLLDACLPLPVHALPMRVCAVGPRATVDCGCQGPCTLRGAAAGVPTWTKLNLWVRGRRAWVLTPPLPPSVHQRCTGSGGRGGAVH